MLQHAEIINEDDKDIEVVKPGTTVTLLDLADNESEHIQL